MRDFTALDLTCVAAPPRRPVCWCDLAINRTVSSEHDRHKHKLEVITECLLWL